MNGIECGGIVVTGIPSFGLLDFSTEINCASMA